MTEADFNLPLLKPYLTPAELRRLLALVTVTKAANLWSPCNAAQQMLLESRANVIGFGGAAGGGKTDGALGRILKKHKVAAFFRRESTQLFSVFERLKQILGGNDKGFNRKWMVWDNVGPRRVQVQFGSVPNLGDEQAYQGRPKDCLVIDEAANFLESQVRFLMGWVRTTDPTQETCTLMMFNPPTSTDGEWIIRFFAPWLDDRHPNPAKPGELRWFAVLNGKDTEVDGPTPFMHNGEQIFPQSRTFIPSRVTDNPFLMGTNYYAQLQALPEPLRSQMLYGDFKIGLTDDPFQVIPTAWVDAAMNRWVDLQVKPPMDVVGVDVARGGRDSTAIARRHGMWFDKLLTYQGEATNDGPKVAGLVMAAKRDRAPIALDIIGVGCSPYDFLKQNDQQILGIRMDEPSLDTDRSGMLKLKNARTAMWWRLRELLDPAANTGIALPPDQELRAELTMVKWRVNGGTIVVESRDEILKRLQRSPDKATAVALAAMDIPKWFPSQQPGARKEHRVDWDPMRPLDDQGGDWDPLR